MVKWFNLLVLKTRGYIPEARFAPIIGLLLDKYASATLVQCLIERWWDTTHTFHIFKQEMTVTPYNFYCMTGLSFEGAIISLDGVSGIQLGLYMLGRKYSFETIGYFDLVLDYMFLPQRTTEEYVRIDRAFLLHLSGAYLFINGKQMVSLRWHGGPTRGKHVLLIFTLTGGKQFGGNQYVLGLVIFQSSLVILGSLISKQPS